jgi:hypothetical protein
MGAHGGRPYRLEIKLGKKEDPKLQAGDRVEVIH